MGRSVCVCARESTSLQLAKKPHARKIQNSSLQRLASDCAGHCVQRAAFYLRCTYRASQPGGSTPKKCMCGALVELGVATTLRNGDNTACMEGGSCFLLTY